MTCALNKFCRLRHCSKVNVHRLSCPSSDSTAGGGSSFFTIITPHSTRAASTPMHNQRIACGVCHVSRSLLSDPRGSSNNDATRLHSTPLHSNALHSTAPAHRTITQYRAAKCCMLLPRHIQLGQCLHISWGERRPGVDVVWCGVVWCAVVPCGVGWCGVGWGGFVWCKRVSCTWTPHRVLVGFFCGCSVARGLGLRAI